MVGLTKFFSEFSELNHPQLFILKARLGESIGLNFLIVQPIDDFLDGFLLLLSLFKLSSEYILILGCFPLLQPVLGHNLQSIVDIVRSIDEHSLEV